MKKVLNFIKSKSTIILIASLVLIMVIFVILAGIFLPKTEGSEYGNRLNDIEKHVISDEVKDSIITSIKETTKTSSQTVTVQGKILKININVNDDVSLEDSKKIYDSFKDKFTEDILSYYDIEILLNNKDYAVFGYRKAGYQDVKWTNNK